MLQCWPEALLVAVAAAAAVAEVGRLLLQEGLLVGLRRLLVVLCLLRLLRGLVLGEAGLSALPLVGFHSQASPAECL